MKILSNSIKFEDLPYDDNYFFGTRIKYDNGYEIRFAKGSYSSFKIMTCTALNNKDVYLDNSKNTYYNLNELNKYMEYVQNL